MTSSDVVNIKFKCPKCGQLIEANIDKSDLEFVGGIASTSLLHGSPPHVAVVYIDTNGEVRGVEVPEVTLQIGAPAEAPAEESVEVKALREVDPSIVTGVIDEEFLVASLVYLIADMPVYFVFQTIDERYYRALEEFGRIVGNNTKVLRDELSDSRALVAVSSSFYLKNEREITKSCALYTLTRKMRCHVPKSKVFRKLIRDHLSSSEKALGLSSVLKYYIGLVEAAYDVVKRYGSIKRKDLGKTINISSKELDVVVDCLVAKGVKLEKDLLSVA